MYIGGSFHVSQLFAYTIINTFTRNNASSLYGILTETVPLHGKKRVTEQQRPD